MTTLIENTRSAGSSAYFGERGSWFIAAAVHRDSDCLTRSNFDVFKRELNALPEVKAWSGDESPIQIERFTHWAVGWCDYLIIDPACQAAVALAESMREQLENYPVADDEHFSATEQTEADETWANCYNPKERIACIRQHRSQFEFSSCVDLLGCVRGKYFAGYASELLS
jgi:hypothetical protein